MFGLGKCNATFNNISVILCPSVLLVEETEIPGENHQPAEIKLYHIINVSSTPPHEWDSTQNCIDDRH